MPKPWTALNVYLSTRARSRRYAHLRAVLHGLGTGLSAEVCEFLDALAAKLGLPPEASYELPSVAELPQNSKITAANLPQGQQAGAKNSLSH